MSLNGRLQVVLKLVAEDYKPYDPATTDENIAQKLADCFIEIIRRAVGFVEPTVLEK